MTPTQRTRHPACCSACMGTGWASISTPHGSAEIECDHTFRCDVTGPTEDEQRIAELENTIARMMAETEASARRVRDVALEEAATTAERVFWEPVRWEPHHRNDDDGKRIARAIRALKEQP